MEEPEHEREAHRHILAAVSHEHGTREQEDVLLALPERREGDRELVEPRVQVAAEGARGLLRHEIAVRRAHDPHIDGLGGRRADRHDLAGLQDPQELRLRLERHVADLVEEQRPAVRRTHEARLVAIRAREGPALVPEELALEEGLRDGGAVDGDEGAAAPRHAVQLARRDLLARPALTAEDDAEGRRRDALEALEQLVDLGAAEQGARRVRAPRAPGLHRPVEAVADVPHRAVEHELEDGVSDADLAAVLEPRRLHERAVHERPVAAPRVGDAKRVALSVDDGVPPGDGVRRDDDLTRRLAPERHARLREQVHAGDRVRRRDVEGDQPRRGVSARGAPVHLHRGGRRVARRHVGSAGYQRPRPRRTATSRELPRTRAARASSRRVPGPPKAATQRRRCSSRSPPDASRPSVVTSGPRATEGRDPEAPLLLAKSPGREPPERRHVGSAGHRRPRPRSAATPRELPRTRAARASSRRLRRPPKAATPQRRYSSRAPPDASRPSAARASATSTRLPVSCASDMHLVSSRSACDGSPCAARCSPRR